MFAIHFDATGAPDAGNVAVGTIVLGSYRETFESPLHMWRRGGYERHWALAVRRLVDGAETTALITELYDPVTANFIKWWPAYRFGEEVRFHNQLLFMESLGSPLDPADVYRHVPPYAQTNEDGDRISEWSVPLASLQRFLAPAPS
jgi:hypothetical protein